jgi:hypothetical protein
MISKLSPDQLGQARMWRKHGVSWAETGRRLHVSDDTVRRAIDPDFQRAEREKEKRRKQYRDERQGHVRERRDRFRPDEETFRAQAALIPLDTRTEAQRFLDEPLPGRSALDKARAEGRWL